MNVMRYLFEGDEVYYARVKNNNLIIIYEKLYDECTDLKFENFRTTQKHYKLDNYKKLIVSTCNRDNIRDINLEEIAVKEENVKETEDEFFINHLYFVCKFH